MLSVIVTLIGLGILFGTSNCSQFKTIISGIAPPLNYDVLNPSEEVKKNPLALTEEGHSIVNESFMDWVQDLVYEVTRLRVLAGE